MAKKQIKTLVEEKKLEQYQSVWLTFNDGTRAGFIGKAVARPGEKKWVVGMEFTVPKPMPDGCSFAKLEDLK